MPAELRRHFEVVFKPLAKSQPVPMRQIGSEHVGKLVSVQVQSSAATWPTEQFLLRTLCNGLHTAWPRPVACVDAIAQCALLRMACTADGMYVSSVAFQ